MRNVRMLIAFGIILAGSIFLPAKADPYTDDRVTTETLKDLYVVTENLELGIEPLYRLSGSGKVDNIKSYNLTFNHIMNVNTSFRILLGYMSYEVVTTSSSQTIGEVRNIVFRPSIIQSLVPYNRKITPYLGGGLNFYRSYDQKSLLPGFTMWMHRDYAWGAHLTTGVRYSPNENMVLSIDIFRDWQLSSIAVKRSSQERSPWEKLGLWAWPHAKVNLNMWIAGLNFSFRF